MRDLREAAEELIKEWDWECGEHQNKALAELIEALRQALAQPEQEPVAWVECAVIPWLQSKDTNVYAMTKLHRIPNEHYDTPLYTTPSNREWVGLTDEELLTAYGWIPAPGAPDWILNGAKEELLGALRKVEAKLKEKNT